jgi:hypothetical protein
LRFTRPFGKDFSRSLLFAHSIKKYKIDIGWPYDRAKLGTDLSFELGVRQREET